MGIPRIPRTLFALKKAREFLAIENIQDLPVDPFAIASRHSWGPIPVGPLAKRLKRRRKEIIGDRDADAIYCNGQYRIVYNEQVASKYRIRWTIMHEIGHIILGHLDYEETRITSTYLAKWQKAVLEREADFFAAEVLAPLAVLRELGVTKWNEIQQLCKISKKASENRERDLILNGYKKNHNLAEAFYEKQFKELLQPVTICTNCNDISVRTFGTLPEVPIVNKMHNFVETDENGRFIICPRCGNDQFSEKARYCRICGLELYNKCQNEDSRAWGIDCGLINAGNARFCEFCGAETLLSRKGLLRKWQHVIETEGEIATALDPSNRDFSPPKSEDNSELPF